MNYVIARGSSKFRQNGRVLDKADKLHLNRSSFVVALAKYNETKDGRHVLLHPQGMLGQGFTTHDVTSLTMHDVTSPLL